MKKILIIFGVIILIMIVPFVLKFKFDSCDCYKIGCHNNLVIPCEKNEDCENKSMNMVCGGGNPWESEPKLDYKEDGFCVEGFCRKCECRE